MEYKQDTFIWSENWWIEGNRAWFVDGVNNILFRVNLNTEECEEAINIPDTCLNKYKLTPHCVKCGNVILCVPGIGESIWVYHLDDGHFSKIDCGKNEGVQWGVELWNWRETVFLVLVRSNRIIELDIGKSRIKKMYIICDDSVGRSTMAGNSIFMLSSKCDKIYRFDCSTKNIESYMLPDIGKKFYNICFDGKRFLISGYGREIYVWNKESNQLAVLDNFPEDLEEYDLANRENVEMIHGVIPIFIYVRTVGKYVWFIPWRANRIVYIDKDSGKAALFEVSEIDEIKLTRAATLPQYLWEYIKEDRYIGLFSAKNNRIVEIDTKELKYQWKDYSISKKCAQQCNRIFNGVYVEDNVLHNKLYQMKLHESDYNVSKSNVCSIGSKIFKNLREGE